MSLKPVTPLRNDFLAGLAVVLLVDIVIRAEAGELKATARGCADQPAARV